MLLDRGVSHAPMVPGATPTPTQAARVGAPVEPGAEHPGKVYAPPPGVPFFAAALYASQHGYSTVRYVDPTGGGTADYPVDAAAMTRYARAAGTQTAVATARAGEPGERYGAPFLGVNAQSVPPMGGAISSPLGNALATSLIHTAQGSGSVWATSPLHAGIAGGVLPSEVNAGGPEKGRRP
jgi:hypothetical protein